jgi:hypothetical protein
MVVSHSTEDFLDKWYPRPEALWRTKWQRKRNGPDPVLVFASVTHEVGDMDGSEQIEPIFLIWTQGATDDINHLIDHKIDIAACLETDGDGLLISTTR